MFASLFLLVTTNLVLVCFGPKAISTVRSQQRLDDTDARIAALGLLVTVLIDFGLVVFLLIGHQKCVLSDTNLCGVLVVMAALLFLSSSASVLPTAICSKKYVDFFSLLKVHAENPL